MKALRNVLIICGAAAAVDLLPKGGEAANTISAALGALLGVAIGLLALRMYRESGYRLRSLEDRQRAIGYIAVGAIVADAACEGRLSQTTAGELAFFIVLGLAIWALVQVWRESRSLS
ncbi:MAG TPA: hypothetical protein VHX88_15190 [Solirubrobacteraceae bacterium]|nr:hypothetical protein [Solirubrobacteraceae bacterium]